MLRFICRLIAFASLSIAIILSIGDAVRSVVQGNLSLSPLGASLREFSPNLLEKLAVYQSGRQSPLLDQTANYVLNMPGALLFAGLFLILYVISLRRKKARAL